MGSRLVWSDGEEAGRLWNRGNIMWSDGMPGHLTDDAVDEDGPYLCDHCSSAAAMFERDAWQAAGGFDERYFPAVRHELDLCIALWRSGRTVICDPRSTVRHRGAAMVRPDAGALESWEFRAFLADRSRRLLLEKWGEALAAYEERPPEHPPRTAELRHARERTVRRAAEQAGPVDGSPRSVRPLTAPDGGWPGAVDADMERRLLAAQVAVQAEFCDTLAVASRAQGARLHELEQELAALRPKAHTHDLILAGRWWRLRRRIDPAVRAVGWMRRVAGADGSGEAGGGRYARVTPLGRQS